MYIPESVLEGLRKQLAAMKSVVGERPDDNYEFDATTDPDAREVVTLIWVLKQLEQYQQPAPPEGLEVYVGIGNDKVEDTLGTNLVLYAERLHCTAAGSPLTLGDVRIHLNELADNGQLWEKLGMYLRANPRFATKAAREEPLEPCRVRDILSLADVDAPLSAIETWTREQRKSAVKWAGLVHLHASDNDDIEVPDKPWFLNDYPSIKLDVGGLWPKVTP